MSKLIRLRVDDKLFTMSQKCLEKFPDNSLNKSLKGIEVFNFILHDNNNVLYVDINPASLEVIVNYLRGYQINKIAITPAILQMVHYDSVRLNLPELTQILDQDQCIDEMIQVIPFQPIPTIAPPPLPVQQIIQNSGIAGDIINETENVKILAKQIMDLSQDNIIRLPKDIASDDFDNANMSITHLIGTDINEFIKNMQFTLPSQLVELIKNKTPPNVIHTPSTNNVKTNDKKIKKSKDKGKVKTKKIDI